jgi:hypothetical protein
MPNDLKERIKEFSSIAKSCPENLQEICFELLLKDYLSQIKAPIQKSSQPQHTDQSKSDDSAQNAVIEEESSQEDFKITDLHVKARKFLSDQDLNIDHINQIFYKEGEKVEPLFDDLKTTKSAESQTRIALLQALKYAISSGSFEFDGETVREETVVRKCYDASNFTANFKNNKTFFEGFEKYDKKSAKIKLSKYGRDELAAIIRDLQ